jgi:hypothetical protein
MTRVTHPSHRGSRSEGQVVRVSAPRGTGVFVLRGVIGGELVDELGEALWAAIDEGLAAVVLDLGEVEAVSSSARDVVASASSTLADRGGRLLAWAPKDASDGASYVMRELRDGSELAPLVVDEHADGKRQP